MKRQWQTEELIEHWTLQPEDLRALTPLFYAHVNPYGRFRLDLEERLRIDPSLVMCDATSL